MCTKKQIWTLVLLVFFSCSNEHPYEESALANSEELLTESEDIPPTTGNSDKIEGVIPLSDQWFLDTIYYLARDVDDNSWIELKSSDTGNFPEFTITKVYLLNLQKGVRIKKIISINPQTKLKTSEADIYSLKLNNRIESRLKIGYNFTKGEYYADFLDSIGTDAKIAANRSKVDSISKRGVEQDAYLCGTGNIEMLWEGVPYLPIPRDISKDSALFVIENWTGR